jgi:hypothetical protein
MMPKALYAGAAALAVTIGCGAMAGAPPDTTAAKFLSSATPAPAPTPVDRAGGGGALPVVPVGGGACIAGLNCGCIRYITCPGTIRHHPPTPANNHPPPPPAPDPGGG